MKQTAAATISRVDITQVLSTNTGQSIQGAIPCVYELKTNKDIQITCRITAN